MPASSLQIAASGPNGVMLRDDSGPLYAAQFDGKDNPGLGMMAGSKNTFALKKISDSSFEVTSKLGGKPMYVEIYSVSADGKTLTIDGTPTNAAAEKYKIVFDRQP